MIESVLPFSRVGLGSIAQVGGKNASLGELMAPWGDGALRTGTTCRQHPRSHIEPTEEGTFGSLRGEKVASKHESHQAQRPSR